MRGMLVMALVCVLFAAPASAVSLSDHWDIGDISGGYSTNTYTYNNESDLVEYVNLSINVSGVHKITNSYASLFPRYLYDYDKDGNYVSREQIGYEVFMSVYGTISPLTVEDVGGQSQYNDFNARGISIWESTWIETYKSYNNYDDEGHGIGDYELRSNSGSNVTIHDFQIDDARGNYREYTRDYGGPGYGAMPLAGGGSDPSGVTYFNYNVTWLGDFLPGTVTPGFVLPAVTTEVRGGAVPEPTTWVLLLSGLGSAILFIRRRR